MYASSWQMMTVCGIRQDFRERGSQTEYYENGGRQGGDTLLKNQKLAVEGRNRVSQCDS